jgi:hypothetical protein
MAQGYSDGTVAGWPERGVRFLTEARAASALVLGTGGLSGYKAAGT